MLAFLLLALAAPAQPIQDPIKFPPGTTLIREMQLTSVDTGEKLMLLQARSEKLDPPKRSPLNGWVFEHVTAGFARDRTDESFNLRFRVFNQYRPDKNDPTDYVARMMLRLWDFNRQRLNRDHSDFIHLRAVDVYLVAFGGSGAEQQFMEDPFELDENDRPARANNIYIYSVSNLDDPLEFARELAHEYGHATLPGIGGYSEPEDWANGDLGERVYMTWLLQAMKAGKLRPADVMHATMDQMQGYYDKTVLPDLKRVGTKGPSLATLARRDKSGYRELLGLASYCAAMMPHKMFGRAVALTASPDAEGFLKGVVEAAAERAEWKVTVPMGLPKNGQIWVPMAKGKVVGAKELQRRGDWVKIQITTDSVTVVNETPAVGPS
ncbi:MAG: hypothetical protein IH945_00970 [Armatimonadetes bacterium]|nr:hypothetical protein [Armatimonadota bacterium]